MKKFNLFNMNTYLSIEQVGIGVLFTKYKSWQSLEISLLILHIEIRRNNPNDK